MTSLNTSHHFLLVVLAVVSVVKVVLLVLQLQFRVFATRCHSSFALVYLRRRQATPPPRFSAYIFFLFPLPAVSLLFSRWCAMRQYAVVLLCYCCSGSVALQRLTHGRTRTLPSSRSNWQVDLLTFTPKKSTSWMLVSTH